MEVTTKDGQVVKIMADALRYGIIWEKLIQGVIPK